MEHVSDSTSVDTKRIVSALNALVETCKDGEKGYKNAAADVRDLTFRAIFTHYSQQRAQFAAALQSIIERYGGYPEDKVRFGGAIRRCRRRLKGDPGEGARETVLSRR